MDLLLLSVVALSALALLFDFTNGFMDAANSVATVVATRTMSVRAAVWFSACFNFLAYFFVGTAVANTVAKTVHTQGSGVTVVFAALVAAIAWNYIAWYRCIPSSSSHAIIGGLVGAGMTAGGVGAVNWGCVGKTVAAIVLSPLVAFAIAGLATVLVAGLQRATHWGDDARPFRAMQVVSAAAVSFGHGANDAQKTMGVISALLVGAGYVAVDPVSHQLSVPWYVAFAAYAAIAAGTVWGGWRIIRTMGLRITNLNSRTGVAANIGATTAIFGATAMGIPISTTHAAASSVVGAGTAARRGTNWGIVGQMGVAWVCTIPATAVVGCVMYSLTQLPTVFAWCVLGPLLLTLGALMVWAMAHCGGAEEIEAEMGARTPTAAAPGTEFVTAELDTTDLDTTELDTAELAAANLTAAEFVAADVVAQVLDNLTPETSGPPARAR